MAYSSCCQREHELTRVDPAVVDTEGDEVDLLALDLARVDGGILLLKVECELWAVVASVRLGKDAKVPSFVLWELGIEGLQELPDSGSRGNGGGGIITAIAEAGADWLVNI